MVGKLILRGIVVGIFAGLIAFAWAQVFGEPLVDAAIAFEAAHEAADAGAQTQSAVATAAHEHEHEQAGHEHVHAAQAVPHEHGHDEDTGGHTHGGADDFSREVQSGIGLLTGIVAIGAALGGLFGILFAFANGRMGSLGPAPTAALLALLGLLSFYLVPALKYPANPPATGAAGTIQLRTAMYFLMMAISLVATLLGLLLRQRLARAYGEWNGSLMAAGAYLAAIAAAFAILPGFNEVPEGFPAATLWQFRLASMGIQTVLWMSLGILFGTMVDSTASRSSARLSAT